MFQVRIYLLMLSKYPRKSKGYFGYRLETIDKQGRVHEKTVYDEEEDITANQLALVAMYRAFEELKSPARWKYSRTACIFAAILSGTCRTGR